MLRFQSSSGVTQLDSDDDWHVERSIGWLSMVEIVETGDALGDQYSRCTACGDAALSHLN